MKQKAKTYITKSPSPQSSLSPSRPPWLPIFLVGSVIVVVFDDEAPHSREQVVPEGDDEVDRDEAGGESADEEEGKG